MSSDVLLVGLGQIGMGYDIHFPDSAHVYSHARAFKSHPDFDLVGAVDTNRTLRERFTGAYDAPAYEDTQAALCACSPDVVVVAVPTALHAGTVRSVLEAPSVRALLCEKPLAYDLAEARGIVDACVDRGVPLYVNYMRRSEPGAVRVGERIASGAIPLPVKGTAWYSKGFLHNGSHMFNLLEYWLGPMTSATVLDRGRQLENDDAEPDVRVVFRGGSVVFLAAREEDYSHHAIELLSSSGRLRYERGGEVIEWAPVESDPNFPGYKGLALQTEPFAAEMNRYQWHVADQLARALAGRPFNLCSGAAAFSTLESMHVIMGQR